MNAPTISILSGKKMEKLLGGRIFDVWEAEDTAEGEDGGEGRHREGFSNKFPCLIREMFPDVDVPFLWRECRSLNHEEDIARFINTVMLNGIYPKKSRDRGVVGSFPEDNEIHFLDDFYSKPVTFSSDEESTVEVEEKCGGLHGNSHEVGTANSVSGIAAVNGRGGEEESGCGEVVEPFETGDYHSIYDTNGEQILTERNQRFTDRDGDPRKEGADGVETAGSVSDLGNREAPTKWKAAGSSSSAEELAHGEEEAWLDEQTAELIRLFPNADPTYLREECAKLKGALEGLNEFVISKLGKNDMPSRADYEKRREMKQQQDMYTKNFSIEDFLKVIPDPWTHFGVSQTNGVRYKAQSVIFLKKSYTGMHFRYITNVLRKNNFSLYLSYKELQGKCPPVRCDPESNLPATMTAIQFLQEVAFIRHEEELRDFIRAKESEKQTRLEEAKRCGRVLECKCCYDPEIVIDDIVYCEKDHPFCKTCVARYVEVEMGRARFEFPCLAGCSGKFTASALQNALTPELRSRIMEQKQMEEIERAGIEDLVQCPFCRYAVILPPEDKVLHCLNSECRKKTCRLCKEPCHIPLRCDEVEKSEEVKMRTYIENKMTQALIRTCYKCGKGFVKADGCNKIECTCGAKMCYVCRKPVNDYSHFSGQKGTDCGRCPLFSTNDELHGKLVKKAGRKAKEEILGDGSKMLKHDPTLIFEERKHKKRVS